MDTERSDSELVAVRRNSALMFCKNYLKVVILIMSPIILMPIAFVGGNKAYLCFYIFLITTVYWALNVSHPSIIAIITLAILLIASLFTKILIRIYICNIVLESFGAMCFIAAIENSKVHKRVAIKILSAVGCSQYKLSFILFFTTMTASMWFPNTTVCGLMIPIVKAILEELEGLGLLEVNENRNKTNNEINDDEPTDLTTFYFLGVAYSSSIGAMATFIGSETNQIYKIYFDMVFPMSLKIEFAHFILLTLPGVLILEAFLYFWMNFYFLGMFRAQNNSVLRCGMSEEEDQYVKTLLSNQYQKLGRLSTYEMIVCVLLLLTLIVQIVTRLLLLNEDISAINKINAPSIIFVALLFIIPKKLRFLNIFGRSDSEENVSRVTFEPCLTWRDVKNTIQWSVLFVIVSSDTMFEVLKINRMTDEFEKFLMLFQSFGSTWVVLATIVLCKVLTEFASNTCLVSCLLPHITRMSVALKINPHYLMTSAVLAGSLPFHVVTGSPVNSLVSTYVNIPHRKMFFAGTGLSVIGLLVVWLTSILWSGVVWQITLSPNWADWVKVHELL